MAILDCVGAENFENPGHPRIVGEINREEAVIKTAQEMWDVL